MSDKMREHSDRFSQLPSIHYIVWYLDHLEILSVQIIKKFYEVETIIPILIRNLRVREIKSPIVNRRQGLDLKQDLFYFEFWAFNQYTQITCRWQW